MKFAHHLKVWLRAKEKALEEKEGYSDVSPFVRDDRRMGSTQTGQYGDINVDWDKLDAAIDEFCAEFSTCPKCRTKAAKKVVES